MDSNSPFNTSKWTLFTSTWFYKTLKPENISLYIFCVNYRGLEANCDSLQEVLINMSSNGLTIVFICFTDVLHHKINGYHNLLYNTRLDTDDGHGGVGLYISGTLSKQGD